jgi:hypothetical protein
VDRGSHFVTTPVVGGPVDREQKTQIGRALEQLGLELIAAYSPQARGRCERLFGTWQGRLVAEFRARQITTLEAAHRFLTSQWLGIHNRKFKVAPLQSGTAFVPYRGTELDKIFSIQQERVVGNDNTVRFENLTLQIEAQPFRYSLARCRILVCRHLDATLSVYYGQHRLGRYDATGAVLSAKTAPQARRHSAGKSRVSRAVAATAAWRGQ